MGPAEWQTGPDFIARTDWEMVYLKKLSATAPQKDWSVAEKPGRRGEVLRRQERSS